MARWGRVDYKQLKRLQQRMEKLEKAQFEKFCKDMAKEIAARLLAKVIKRTPVGLYDGRVGGTLRRGWTSKSHQEAESGGGGTDVKRFAEALNVAKKGQVYEIEIVNPVHYAAYVEFGHRTRNHRGWVKGRFMMTISANELQGQAPKIIEKKLIKLLGDAFNGN